MFVLTGIPIPPSHNHAYTVRPVRRKGSAKKVYRPTRSDEYESYMKEFAVWQMENAQLINSLRAQLSKYEDPYLDVRVYLGMRRERLYTAKGEARKLDSANYLKIIHDLIAKAIGVDDRWFWIALVEKAEVGDNDQECLTITMEFAKTRKMSEVWRTIRSPKADGSS